MVSRTRTRSGCNVLKSQSYFCLSKMMGHIFLEIMPRHMLNKEMSGDSRHGFTKGIVPDKSGDLL